MRVIACGVPALSQVAATVPMAPPAWVCRTLMTKAEFVRPELTLMPVKSKEVMELPLN
jgi:hypothetical protein